MSALKVILPLLASNDVATRRRAVQALALGRDRAGFEKLVERAIQDPAAEVREQAINEMTELHGATEQEMAPAKAVMEQLLGDPRSRIAAYAVWGRLLRSDLPLKLSCVSIAAHVRNSFQLVKVYRETLRSRVGRIFLPVLWGAASFTVLADIFVLLAADRELSGTGLRLILMTAFFNVPLGFLLVVLGTRLQVAWGRYPSRLGGLIVESSIAAGLGGVQGGILGAIFAPFLIAPCPNDATLAQYGIGISVGAWMGGAAGLLLRAGAIAGYGSVGSIATARWLGIAASLSLLTLGLYTILGVALSQGTLDTFLQSRALWMFLTGGAIAAGQASAIAELDHRGTSSRTLRRTPWIGIGLILVAVLVIVTHLREISSGIESLYPQVNKPPRCMESKGSASAR